MGSKASRGLAIVLWVVGAVMLSFGVYIIVAGGGWTTAISGAALVVAGFTFWFNSKTLEIGARND